MNQFFFTLILIAITTTVFSQNLITNPSAELDPTSNGWTAESGDDWQSGNEVTAVDGSFHFFAGNPSSSEPLLSELYQDVDVSANASNIDAGTAIYFFEGYIRTFDGSDESQIIVEYRDASGNVLGSYDTGLQTNDCWILYSDNRTAPTNTRTVRIRLFSNRLNGFDSDGYIDKLYLGTTANNSGTTNLIVNHSAECDPTTNGWTQTTGNWVRGNEVTAQEGDFHFFAGVSPGIAILYQDVDVSAYASTIDAGIQNFDFEGYMRTSSGNDQSRIVVEYRDMSGNILDTYDTLPQVDTDWTSFSDTRTAPVGTRIIRISLISERFSGTDSDGYHDNLSLIPLTAVLPVELLSFNVSKTENESVKIEWQTGSEINNDFFTIERSLDGVKWDRLKTVKGAGNSSRLLTYSTIDNEPVLGVSYYRLKQTDFDGKYSYSSVESISINKLNRSHNKLVISPNPTTDAIHVSMESSIEGSVTVRLTDMAGREVLNKEEKVNAGAQVLHYDVHDLKAGCYLLQLTQRGISYTHRVVIN